MGCKNTEKKVIFRVDSNKKNCTFAVSIRGVAQLASALAWGARGRKFESSHPDRVIKKGCIMFATFFYLYLFEVHSTK